MTLQYSHCMVWIFVPCDIVDIWIVTWNYSLWLVTIPYAYYYYSNIIPLRFQVSIFSELCINSQSLHRSVYYKHTPSTVYLLLSFISSIHFSVIYSTYYYCKKIDVRIACNHQHGIDCIPSDSHVPMGRYVLSTCNHEVYTATQD